MKRLFPLTLATLLAISAAQAQSQQLVNRIVTVEPSPGEKVEVSISVDSNGTVFMTEVANGARTNSFDITIPRTTVPDLEAVLKKSIEWQNIATKNQVMPFEKKIGTIGSTAITFDYKSKDIETSTGQRTRLSPYNVHPEDAPIILKALPEIPALEKELAAKVAQSKKEYDLFQ